MVEREMIENYLECIYILLLEKRYIRSVDIAKQLKFRRSSVSIALKELKDLNYVKILNQRYIKLSRKGLKLAQRIYERHIVLSELLIALGVSKSTALKDACKIEHYLSEESYSILKEFYEEQIKKRAKNDDSNEGE